MSRFIDKKIPHIFFVLIVLFFLSFTTKTYAATCPGSMAGTGIVSDPCLITNWTTLDAMRNGLTLYYQLSTNLSSTTSDYTGLGSNWTPVGTSTAKFTGFFNGNTNTISDLVINKPTTDNVGLFGYTTNTISNIGLINVNITGQLKTGALVGFSQGTISNSYSTGIVTGTTNVGGITGQSQANITNCYSAATISGSSNSGGLVGSYGTGAMSGSHATGNVTTTGGSVGGLSGVQDSGTISSSYATGNATSLGGVSANAGGLVGFQSGGTISQCYAVGNAAGPGGSSVGGLVGQPRGTILNSYAMGSAKGGFAGYSMGNITNCYSTGVSSSGGLIGTKDGGSITGSYWDVETSGKLTSAAGTGTTTAKMQTQDTFSGWDFSTIWGITSSFNGGYPYLLSVQTPPTVPDAPIIGTATSGDMQASITFTAPVSDGGAVIDYYTASSSPGGINVSTTSATSVVVTGLSNGTPYTFTIYAHNSIGTSSPSSASNEVTPVNPNASPNIPVLVSPANASSTSDTTPTLSATYSDTDTDDTGTTNYRISSSTAQDCLDEVSIVSSGASSETATNNATTTYTPDSSIGSDGTYYWCAQNNDGVATSSWTSMGSFVLDTIPPTITNISSSIGWSNATISWSTDGVSNSTVLYGLTPSYGSITATTTAESISIVGLFVCKTYNYQVSSWDDLLNLATSSNYTFKTLCHRGHPIVRTIDSSSSTQTANPPIVNQVSTTTETVATTTPTTETVATTTLPTEPQIIIATPNLELSDLINLLISLGIIDSSKTNLALSLLGQSDTTTHIFTKDLQLGQLDTEVSQLQKFLNMHDFIVAQTGAGSPGNESNYFGVKTRSALIKFQKANNVTPTLGYFGAKTRKVVNQ